MIVTEGLKVQKSQQIEEFLSFTKFLELYASILIFYDILYYYGFEYDISNPIILEEKTDFQNELDKIEQEISENHFLNSSFGVGDRMYRRLAINAKDKNKNS